MDKRWHQLADILVNYSTEVKPGERVMIAMGEIETFPLIKAVYESVIKAGAYPQVQFLSEKLRHTLLKYGNSEQIIWCPEIEVYGMEWADVYIGLRGACNLYEHSDIPSDKLAMNQSVMGKISSLRWDKTRWVLVRVPNETFAQQAETDLETLMEMFFSACLVNWETEALSLRRISKVLEKGSMIRIIGHRTDLCFSVKDRKWFPSYGKINMPDGEIYTSPVTSSLNGYIFFEFPG
ncbi:MAG: aminopeptidase, partial [Spirochaetota bacterium]